MNSTSSFFNRGVDFQALSKTADLGAREKKHLTKVYTSLVATVLAATLGVMFHISFNVGGILTTMGGIIVLLGILMTPHTPLNVEKRFGMLLGFGALQGMSIGPLISQVAAIDPSIITTAFMGTCAIFICFSAGALLAEKRSYLYLGGFLFSGLSLMMTLNFLNIFFRSYFIFNFQIYFGLLIFCGFLVFDTQLVIEKFNHGDDDFIKHSVELFIDFVNIFVRILIILSKDKKKESRR